MPASAGAARGMAHTMERIAYAEEAPTDDEVVGAEAGSAAVRPRPRAGNVAQPAAGLLRHQAGAPPVRASRLVASQGPG